MSIGVYVVVVYKYLREKYFQAFKETGSLRINTLYKLREAEHAPIRDGLEGRRNIKFGSDEPYTTLSGEDFHKLLPMKKMTEQQEEKITVTVEKGTQFDLQIADAYVFCTSLKLDSALYNKFGYDTHYAIYKPYEFAKLLFEKLNETKNFVRCYKLDSVRYVDKPIILTTENKESVLQDRNKVFWDTCFTKPKNFRNEQEFRMVFVPESKHAIKPILLTCPELKKFCKF
jgi:hypothetical protein